MDGENLFSDDQRKRLLAAACQSTAASQDMIEAAREAEINGLIGEQILSGDTALLLADALRLLLSVDLNAHSGSLQLIGALDRFLND